MPGIEHVPVPAPTPAPVPAPLPILGHEAAPAQVQAPVAATAPAQDPTPAPTPGEKRAREECCPSYQGGGPEKRRKLEKHQQSGSMDYLVALDRARASAEA